MRCKGVGEAECGGEMGAVDAGAEQPDWHLCSHAGNGDQPLILFRLRKQPLQLENIMWEVLGAGVEIAAKRARGSHVGARRPTETEIDATRQEGFQRSELLGD